MGRRSRKKGHDWERAIAKLLRPIFGESVHRGHQSFRGGRAAGEGCDVDGSPFWIEAKHSQQTNPRSAIRQCNETQADCSDTRPPVAICKDDRKPPNWTVGVPMDQPIAVMELSDWLDLVEDWARLKTNAGEPLELQRKKRNCR